jgi:hypothetical protein
VEKARQQKNELSFGSSRGPIPTFRRGEWDRHLGQHRRDSVRKRLIRLLRYFRVSEYSCRDARGPCDRSPVSAGFVATGTLGLSDVIDMHFSTPHRDGSTSADPFVEVDFVGVPSRDNALRHQTYL